MAAARWSSFSRPPGGRKTRQLPRRVLGPREAVAHRPDVDPVVGVEVADEQRRQVRRADPCLDLRRDPAPDVEQDAGLAGLHEHARTARCRRRGARCRCRGWSGACVLRAGGWRQGNGCGHRALRHRDRRRRAASRRGSPRPRPPRGPGPSAPPRKTTRVSRWLASGVTTATVTAVSPPRSRTSTASPTSVPPSSRTRSASCSSVARLPSWLGRWVSVSPNASRSAEALAEQAEERPAEPDLDGRQAPAARVQQLARAAPARSARRVPRRARRAPR